jgi:PIN domain nuclease of toxin-antitoxin system
MEGIVADTHAVVWYIVEPQRLSAKAVAAFEGATSLGKPIYVSSITVRSIGRIGLGPFKLRLGCRTLPQKLQSVLGDEQSLARSLRSQASFKFLR